jgi:hypothetical protein
MAGAKYVLSVVASASTPPHRPDIGRRAERLIRTAMNRMGHSVQAIVAPSMAEVRSGLERRKCGLIDPDYAIHLYCMSTQITFQMPPPEKRIS